MRLRCTIYDLWMYVTLDPNLSRIRGKDHWEMFMPENARWCSTPPDMTVGR